MDLETKWADLQSYSSSLEITMSDRGRDKREHRRVSSASILSVINDILRLKLGSEQLQSLQLRLEKDVLFLFCQTFQTEREFSRLTYHQTITKLFHLLQSRRVCEEWMLGGWEEGDSGDHVRCVLMTLRLLLRDEAYQVMLKKSSHSVEILAKSLCEHAEAYLHGSQQNVNTLKELTNIFQKLSSGSCHSECVVVSRAPEAVPWLVHLLRSPDLTLTQSCLSALINICKSIAGVELVTSLSPLPPLLHILQFYDPSSRHLSSDLLLLLTSQSEQATLCLKELDGLPLCLRLLHSDDLHVLHRMVGVIERLCEDRELQDDFRLLGGVPLLLALLSKSVDGASCRDKLTSLKYGSCSAITQLAVNDTNSHHFTQENGVYLLSKLVLPESNVEEGEKEREKEDPSTLSVGLQRNAWRALRYLYSTERNRRQFQTLFPPELYAAFIDVGNYVRQSAVYSSLVHTVNTMTPAELLSLRSSIEECSILRSPLFTVGEYQAHQLLGSGAFGNVYKVKKVNSGTFLAMKEIKCTVPLLGASDPERASSIGKIMNEVNIIREQLHHPNVVLYHKCFKEAGHLYIIMELIEGAPLSDIITSLVEKRERFEEERIWRIFTQLTLALHYLHKEKHVTHRDLKPSNLMIGDTYKLTITDFGLAKQKGREFSVMQSTVGTPSYWCPELVRNEPYTEKADIWAAGCVLYQMATLQVPFQTTNILALAKNIAEVNYPAISEGLYSPLLSTVVSRCLTADVSQRPDSIELGALVARQLMMEADRLATSRLSLQHRLELERQRTLRHRQRYRHLASLTTPIHHETTPTRDRDGSAGSMLRRISESFTTHPPLVTSPTSLQSPITRSTPLHTTLQPRPLPPEPHPPLESVGTDWGHTYSPALLHKRSEVEWDGDNDMWEEVFPETPPQMMTSPHDTSYHSDTLSEVNTSPTNPLSLTPARGRSYSAIVPGRHHSGRGSRTGRGRSLPGMGVAMPGSPLRCRTASTSSSVLCLSSRHFREVSDPISQLLGTLHRLLSLSLATPPSSSPSTRLLVLDRYQRSLFQPSMSPAQIKGELHRLGTRSGEGVWLLEEGAWSVGPKLLRKALEELSAHGGTLMLPPPTSTVEPCTLTYDLLVTMIDSLHRDLETTPSIR